MSDDPSGLGKFVPGFDFLQNLVKNAGSALPGIGQWIAPTLDPAELEKRISELRTVQFWLEQNARMLAATIQALEVQRMTLSTLTTMNVPMAELRETLKIKSPAAEATQAAEGKAARPKAGNAVDPMQWWGALTSQFTQLATNAMKDGAADAARSLATGMVKQSFDAAAEGLKNATGAPARAVARATSTGRAAKTARPAGKRSAPRRPA